MAVLVLNISVSTAQYQLVQLRSDQTTLTKQNQDLTQQVQNFDAPQNLAAKAAELGMVASTGKGQIDLSTLTVSGKAKPAVKGDSRRRRHRRAGCRRPAHRRPAGHHRRSAGKPEARGSRRPRRQRRQPRPRAAAAPAAAAEAGGGPPRRLRPGAGTKGAGAVTGDGRRPASTGKQQGIIVAQSTGKASKAKVPNATKRLRLGLGIMLALLLVVGGKLFLVQGLDVGGMAEAALNNRLTPDRAARRTRQHPGRQRDGAGQQRHPLQHRGGPDRQHQDRVLQAARNRQRQGRTRHGFPGPGDRGARRRPGHGAGGRPERRHGQEALLHRGQGPEAGRRGPDLQAADPGHRHRRHQQARLPERFCRRRHRRASWRTAPPARPAWSRPRTRSSGEHPASGSSRSAPTASASRWAWTS